MKETTYDDKAISAALLDGQLIVAPTDTIYGILAKADDMRAAIRLYSARQRPASKSCIILLADNSDIPSLTAVQRERYGMLNSERPTTIVVSVSDDYLPHLVRQDGTLAFRVVNHPELTSLIRQTGPLLAPSANREGQPPATTIHEAIAYFGNQVAVYVDGGQIANTQPSRIIRYENDGRLTVIRD